MKVDTRFPQLPVLGHVPKKRAKLLLPPLEMDEINTVCDQAYMEAACHEEEWGINCVRKALFAAALEKKRRES